MDKRDKSKKIISLGIVLFLVMLLVSGGTLAYWTWVTAESERTNIALTITAPDMTATLTGYTQTVSNLIPVSSCTDSTYAIKKELTLTYENLSTNDGEILGTLSIENFTSPYGTPDSDDLSHLHYAVTTSPDSCTTEPLEGMSGTLTSITGSLFTSQKLKGPIPAGTTETSQTYYLWVWLDSEYTHQNVGSGVTSDPMQDISFTLVWSGEIKNDLIPLSDPEAPALDEGMIPVTIANDGTVTTVSETDSSWYNYSNKEWANVVLVNENATEDVDGSQSRSYYQSNIGVEVNQSDILAYYVWIPRYAYKIPSSVQCSDINNPTLETYPNCYFTIISESDRDAMNEYMGLEGDDLILFNEALDDALVTGSLDLSSFVGETYVVPLEDFIAEINSESGLNITIEKGDFDNNRTITGAVPIDIQFEKKEATMIYGDAVNSYRTHPAFWWDDDSDRVADDDETIAGIWVGKFRVGEVTAGYNSYSTIIFGDRLDLLADVSGGFQTAIAFSGGVLDTNDGNVTFSGNEFYGLTAQVDSHMMKNGEWGAVAYLSHSRYGIQTKIAEDDDSYGTKNNYSQSTTGNITGIFEMNVSENYSVAVMAVMSDDNGEPYSGKSEGYNSGFNGPLINGDYLTSELPFPNSKYYDLYLKSQLSIDTESDTYVCSLDTCAGHALYETSGWYSDITYFGPAWIARELNSGIFNSVAYDGSGLDLISETFSVLVVG